MGQRRAGPRRSRLVRGLCWANLAGVGLIWACGSTVAESWWPCAALTYLPQLQFGAPTVVLIAAGAWKRDGRSLLLCGCAACLLAIGPMGLRVRLPSAGPNGRALRVMTYNIHGGTLNLAKVLQAIRRADADVVCLQEAQRSSAAPTRALVSAIARGLPDHAFHRAQSIMTLVRAGSVAFDDELLVVGRRSRPIVRARFRHAGRTVTVVNTHFVLSSPVTSAPRTGIREFVRQAVEVRRTQTEALLAATRRERGTLIVCGDFNTPPRGHVYAMLADRWTDAFGAAGSGFGYTFASAMPVLRIDYVWLSRDLRPAGARVPAAAGSDHRPVVVDVAFR